MKMKTLSILILLIVAVFLVPPDLAGQTKKYDIKSGIVTFENSTVMGKIKFTERFIVYFDDYGMKECKETYKDNTLSESFFSDGKTLYTLNHKDKVAYKQGDAYRGTELRFDWNEVSQKEKASGKAKQLSNVTIAGKLCESFEVTSTSGKTVFAGWKGICLMTDLTTSGINVIAKAVKVEENAKVPAEKFKIPAGYKVQ